jgi:hypothetical protein
MATNSSNPEIGYGSYADFVVQKYGGNGYHDYREVPGWYNSSDGATQKVFLGSSTYQSRLTSG